MDAIASTLFLNQTDLAIVFFVNSSTMPCPPEPLRGLAIKDIVGHMHIEDRIYDSKKKGLLKQQDPYSKE